MMKLSLQLPGASPITIPAPSGLLPGYTADAANGGGLYFIVSQVLNLALYIGGALLVFWLSWGIFEYLVAGGNKDKLALGRKKIIHALAGFVVILLAFSAWQYFRQIYTPQEIPGGVTSVTSP